MPNFPGIPAGSTTNAVCTLREENTVLESVHVSIPRSTQLGPFLLCVVHRTIYHTEYTTSPNTPWDCHKYKPVFTALPQQKGLASSKIPVEAPRTANLTIDISCDVMRSKMIIYRAWCIRSLRNISIYLPNYVVVAYIYQTRWWLYISTRIRDGSIYLPDNVVVV
jgi:hypothetical protein